MLECKRWRLKSLCEIVVVFVFKGELAIKMIITDFPLKVSFNLVQSPI